MVCSCDGSLYNLEGAIISKNNMSSLINIETDKFDKGEIQVIEESIKDSNYDWIVDILYVGESTKDTHDVVFTLEREDLGEFLSVMFACGYQFAFKQ